MPSSPPASGKKTLAVLIPDRLSELTAKGESVARYYNPGDFFDEVHIVMTNDDRVDLDAVRLLVGSARPYVHNLPIGRVQSLFALGPGRRLPLPWLRQGIELLRRIGPDVIRVHYGLLEGFLASRAKEVLGIDYVLSLHTVWDKDALYFNPVLDRLYKRAISGMHKTIFKKAAAILCVYQEILRFADAHGSSKSVLLYNPVSRSIREKTDYATAGTPRILTVNRLIPGKNPENILRALRHLDCHYDIVGQGPLDESLQALTRELGLESRVTFTAALPNRVLVERLPLYDLAVFHCDYRGISKGILEASLAGLPIVANRHPVEPIPDYAGNWLVACDNTEDGYHQAIGALLADKAAREAHGRAARAHALAHWDPERMEAAVVDIYARLLESRQNPA